MLSLVFSFDHECLLSAELLTVFLGQKREVAMISCSDLTKECKKRKIKAVTFKDQLLFFWRLRLAHVR